MPVYAVRPAAAVRVGLRLWSSGSALGLTAERRLAAADVEGDHDGEQHQRQGGDERGQPQPAAAGPLVEVVVLVDGLDDAAARRGDRGAGAGAAVPRPVAAGPGPRRPPPTAAACRAGLPSTGSGANSGRSGMSSNGGGGGGFSARLATHETSPSSSKIGMPAWVGWSLAGRAGAASGSAGPARARRRARGRRPARRLGLGGSGGLGGGASGIGHAARQAVPVARPAAGSSAGPPRGGGRRPPRRRPARPGRRRTRAARRRCRPRWSGRSCRGRASPGADGVGVEHRVAERVEHARDAGADLPRPQHPAVGVRRGLDDRRRGTGPAGGQGGVQERGQPGDVGRAPGRTGSPWRAASTAKPITRTDPVRSMRTFSGTSRPWATPGRVRDLERARPPRRSARRPGAGRADPRRRAGCRARRRSPTR